MAELKERLEIRISPEIAELLRREAKRRRVPVAQLVREAIDLLLRRERQSRLQAAEALFQIGAPVADWEEMKREIEEARGKAP